VVKNEKSRGGGGADGAGTRPISCRCHPHRRKWYHRFHR
jgi:hypothetical protein